MRSSLYRFTETVTAPRFTRTPRRPRIVVDALAYSPNDGGFTTAIHDLLMTCKSLTDFEFVIVHDRRYAATFESFGLRTYAVAVPRSLRFFVSLVIIPLLARRLRAAAIHCEISALPWFLGVPGSLTVNDLHFLMDPIAGGRSFRHRVMQLYWARAFVASIRHARIVKTISKTTSDDVQRLVAPTIPIVVAEPPVEHPIGPSAVRKPPNLDGGLRIVFLGSVVPRKNLPYLLDALKLVKRAWRLDVVGNLWWGSDALRDFARDDRVHVHGYVPNSRREELLSAAHLMVMPSRYEGFGYPAAEAMIRGLPILASDVGAFREFVPAAWRFPLDDPGRLAAMIDSIDDERWARMSAHGRELAERFSRANHVLAHRELFRRLLDSGARRTSTTSTASVRRSSFLDSGRALVRRAVTLLRPGLRGGRPSRGE